MKTKNYIFFIIVFYLLVISAIGPIWQWVDNLAIFDLNYFVEISNRISNGQKPYKDFILILPPTTYLIQGLIFKVFGHNIISIIIPAIIMNFFTSIYLFKVLTIDTFNKSIGLIIVTLFVFGSGYTLYPWLVYDNFIFFIIFIYFINHFRFNKNVYIEAVLLILIITTKQNVGVVFFFLIFLFDLYYLNKKLLVKKIIFIIFSFLLIYFSLVYNAILFKDIINQLFFIPFEFRVNKDPFLNLSKLIPNVFSENNFLRFILSIIMSILFVILVTFKKRVKNKYLHYVFLAVASYIFIIYFHYGFIWYFLLIFNIFLLKNSFHKINSENIFLLIIILSSISGFVSGGPTGSSFATTLLMILVSLKSFQISKIKFLKQKKIKFLYIFLILGSSLFQNFFNKIIQNNDSHTFSKIELLYKGIDYKNSYNNNIKELLKSPELIRFSKETAVNIPGDDALFFVSQLSNVLKYNQLYPPTTGLNYNEIVLDIFNKKPKLIFIKYTSKNKILLNDNLSNNELKKRGYYLILDKFGYKVYEKKIKN